jgi:hypothetical protein
MGKFKMTRVEKPAIRERPIVHQTPPPEPKLSPTSQGAPKRSDEVKLEPGGIDPRQQRY